MSWKRWARAATVAAILGAMAQSGAEAQAAVGKSGKSGVHKQSPARAEMLLKAGSALKKLGFYKGEPSGNWGAELRGATEAFQKSRGLKVTGRLNQDTRTALGLLADAVSKPSKVQAADAAQIP